MTFAVRYRVRLSEQRAEDICYDLMVYNMFAYVEPENSVKHDEP